MASSNINCESSFMSLEPTAEPEPAAPRSDQVPVTMSSDGVIHHYDDQLQQYQPVPEGAIVEYWRGKWRVRPLPCLAKDHVLGMLLSAIIQLARAASRCQDCGVDTCFDQLHLEEPCVPAAWYTRDMRLFCKDCWAKCKICLVTQDPSTEDEYDYGDQHMFTCVDCRRIEVQHERELNDIDCEQCGCAFIHYQDPVTVTRTSSTWTCHDCVEARMDAVTEGHLVLDLATGTYMHPSELLCEGCGTGYVSDDGGEIMFEPEASWNCSSCRDAIFAAACGFLPYEGYQEHMEEDTPGVVVTDTDGYQFAECEPSPPAT